MAMDTIVKLIVIIAVSMVLLTCSYQHSEEDPYLAARQRMITEDIQRRGINDRRVLQAMLKVERHLFAPESYRPTAYAARPLPIGEGQTISPPYIVGLMTYHLHLTPADGV